jgi:site-specific DNA-methyltransferase (adenine-specific)
MTVHTSLTDQIPGADGGPVTEIYDRAILYRGDARDILPRLDRDGAIITDPPYGIGYRVNARNWSAKALKATGAMSGAERGPIHGDDAPFDPSLLLRFPKVAVFGANHMNLPTGGRWIVWDKRRDSKPDDHSDCEMVWTNVKGADRIHRQKWRGVVREGEENASRSRKLHPNQKPVALIDFIIDQLGLVSGDTVIDPYMGSGSVGVAALRRGLLFLGIEIDPTHYATARARIRAEIYPEYAVGEKP